MKRKLFFVLLMMAVIAFSSCAKPSNDKNKTDPTDRPNQETDTAHVATPSGGETDTNHETTPSGGETDTDHVTTPSGGEGAKVDQDPVSGSLPKNLEWIVVDQNVTEPERTVDELIEELSKGLLNGTGSAQGSQDIENAGGEAEDDELSASVISTVPFSEEPWENKTVEYTDISMLMYSAGMDDD